MPHADMRHEGPIIREKDRCIVQLAIIDNEGNIVVFLEDIEKYDLDKPIARGYLVSETQDAIAKVKAN